MSAASPLDKIAFYGLAFHQLHDEMVALNCANRRR
jgi:hypothetical protein